MNERDLVGLFLDTISIFQITGKEIFVKAGLRTIQRSSRQFKIGRELSSRTGENVEHSFQSITEILLKNIGIIASLT